MEFPGLEYIAEWELGQMIPAEKLFGISKMEFPPPEQLSTNEIEELIQALLKMILCINNEIILPDEMPATRKYELIIGLWDEGFQLMSNGLYCNDYCTGFPPDCELDEYCKCREYMEK